MSAGTVPSGALQIGLDRKKRQRREALKIPKIVMCNVYNLQNGPLEKGDSELGNYHFQVPTMVSCQGGL